MSLFQSILDKYRKFAFSEKDKGFRFEMLMQRYLMADPKYAADLKRVWLWNEFPYRKQLGSKDTGIDLVALTKYGEYWAIQCKCYSAETTIDKPAVDSFLSTSGRKFKDDEMREQKFSYRLWISTSDKWNATARDTILNQTPPVGCVTVMNLENAPVDWTALENGTTGKSARNPQKSPKAHQLNAIKDTHEYYKTHDRGQLIMACGTGKTYTSLKIAENETGGKGLILYLVPSIGLLAQALKEWSREASDDIKAVCICSDPEASKAREEDDEGAFTVEDLALPATTNVLQITDRLICRLGDKSGGMTVVFSTYQSIDVISKAQKKLASTGGRKYVFDLIICDEAHRTTGVKLSGADESAFTKVHDNKFIEAAKRLYMTATPRLYQYRAKRAAAENDAVLCSMDDKKIYGDEMYRIGFGEAVDLGLLSDYKVLILTIDKDSLKNIPESLREMIDTTKSEDAEKLIGCINALAKREGKLAGGGQIKSVDPEPMKRAVAFCQSIAISKQTTEIFNSFQSAYYEKLTAEERVDTVNVVSDHIDGTMSAGIRDQKLTWLKSDDRKDGECRVLTNVRCLSEGIDVPSLDAVLFLSARNSEIDVVQSVGRVMRKADGKKYGYIIIPIIITPEEKPEEALDDDKRYKVVWSILNALRAHDDRYNSEIENIRFTKVKSEKIAIVGTKVEDPDKRPGTEYAGDARAAAPEDGHKPEGYGYASEEFMRRFAELRNTIYAKLVLKVGSKQYWEEWASQVAEIAKRDIERINSLIKRDGEHKRAFDSFLAGLRKNLNPSVTSGEAVEMLSQHIITRPVFEALFENYSFVKNNPVSVQMQQVLDLFDAETPQEDRETMERFYKSVKRGVEGVDSAEGRQYVIKELYEKFFKTAFPHVVDKLGIVYTPVEVVDFIINSVADALKSQFGRDISERGIHIIDPFVGTGTFITRLLQSGRISRDALEYKYENEIHANEIVLLAYYIASINIENVYHDMADDKDRYVQFNGICLTDTFQLAETDNRGQKDIGKMFRLNSERIASQQNAPIMVIIGNPPYSVGQKSANDNAQNQRYPRLESRIAATYAARTNATNKNSLYDSYIKAFRWASDRIDKKSGGVVAFVSNGMWLDNNAMNGFRKCLTDEFSDIYVFNLRGNARTSGELRRKEKDNIFGSGSRTPIAITMLVKDPRKKGKAAIHYRDVGDYLTRGEKLNIVRKAVSFGEMAAEMKTLTSDAHGDWLSKRSKIFESFTPLGDKDDKSADTVFVPFYSNGAQTNRDTWVYNFSIRTLEHNSERMVNNYNQQVHDYIIALKSNPQLSPKDFVIDDESIIKWSSSLLPRLQQGITAKYSKHYMVDAMYRPFTRQHLYFDTIFIHRPYQIPKLFPTPEQKNLVICVSGVGTNKEFSTIITDTLPDLELVSKSQCFPLYYYKVPEIDGVKAPQSSLFDKDETEYKRFDGVTDFILGRARESYGQKVTKEDIFYYVYGLLHSPEYRKRFAADLKKMLPRIPLVDEPKDFRTFSKEGRALAYLHLNYETLEPWPVSEKVRAENYTVEKMRFAKTKEGKEDRSTIIYNDDVTITGIPLEAYQYIVNGKSALEWLMERYAVTTDKESNIKNDPNDWSKEHNAPRYIIDLVEKVIRVSVETVKIINNLPKLNLEEEQ